MKLTKDQAAQLAFIFTKKISVKNHDELEKQNKFHRVLCEKLENHTFCCELLPAKMIEDSLREADVNRMAQLLGSNEFITSDIIIIKQLSHPGHKLVEVLRVNGESSRKRSFYDIK